MTGNWPKPAARPSDGPWPRNFSISRPGRTTRRRLRLVLLRQARRLAVDLADADLLRRSIEAAASQFQIDVGRYGRTPSPPPPPRPALRRPPGSLPACLRLLDEAVAAEDFAAALDYGHAAYAAAGKARDQALVDDVVARGRLAMVQQQQFQQAREAVAKLSANPDDPQANLEAGRYLAVFRRTGSGPLVPLEQGGRGVLAAAGQGGPGPALAVGGPAGPGRRLVGPGRDAGRAGPGGLVRPGGHLVSPGPCGPPGRRQEPRRAAAGGSERLQSRGQVFRSSDRRVPAHGGRGVRVGP